MDLALYKFWDSTLNDSQIEPKLDTAQPEIIFFYYLKEVFEGSLYL